MRLPDGGSQFKPRYLWLIALTACSGAVGGGPDGPAGSSGGRSGQAGEDDTQSQGLDDEGGVTATPQELATGHELYGQHCAVCHGDDGQGGPLEVPLTDDLGLENLIAVIDGEMPQGDPSVCVGECARLVGLYVQDAFVEGDGPPPLPACEQESPGPRVLRLLTRREYQNTVRDLLGVEPPDVSQIPVEARVEGFVNNARASVVTSRHMDAYVALGEKLATQVVPNRRDQLLPCAPSDSGCGRQFVREFGRRAFRRPLESDEVERYAALFDDSLTEGDFDTGLRLVLQALLASPSFLYRSEVGQDQGDGTFRLTAYETASALSYLFWGSMPDAALFDAAEAGELSTRAQLEAQARRLLEAPRARDQLAEFAVQWLRTEGVLGANKDAEFYPQFSDAVREALMEEQRRFVNHLFFDTQGSFRELFAADYVFANDTLAGFYGIAAQGGEQFVQTPAPAESGRGGILGLGAVLAAHAHPNESSPIKRGLFVRDRLLCQELPPPPDDLDVTPPGLDPTLTTRERFALHTEADACRSCHQYIDGVGFGLEGFDGVGARREVENGIPVDESGEVLGLEGLGQDSLDTFEGPRELGAMLAESESAQNCLAQQYYRFGHGRAGQDADRCSVQRLQAQFRESDFSLRELLVALTQLDSFTLRAD